MRVKLLNRKDLTGLIKKIYKKHNLDIIGFVAIEGSSTGRPFIYYPDELNHQQEFCGKIVGIIKEISEQQISFLRKYNEITLKNAQDKDLTYLLEIVPSIYFYVVTSSSSALNRIRRFIVRNMSKLNKIFGEI